MSIPLPNNLDEDAPVFSISVAAELARLHPQTLRQYGIGAQILSALGLHRIELLSNSPQPRIVGLDAYGLEITGTRPIPEED